MTAVSNLSRMNGTHIWDRCSGTEGPFTLERIFGTARVNMVRVPKIWFGSDKFYGVNDFPVPNFIRAEPNFYPCSDLLKR